MIFGATFKRKFHFASHVLIVLVAQQKAEQRIGVRVNIKGFVV